MGWAEGTGSRREVKGIEPAEAIVVLSGGIKQISNAPLGEWDGVEDRFEGGVQVFQGGKAPLLIFTGGHVPWRPEERPEGEILKERAVKSGVPGEKIQVTGKVGNTETEASAVKEILRYAEREKAKSEIRKAESSSSRVAGDALLVTSNSLPKNRTQNTQASRQPTANGQQHTKPEDGGRMSEDRRQRAVGGKPRIILVTSALHMRRAKMLFERQGFEVEPFPVDFQNSDRANITILSFVPSAQALAKSETAMREGVGLLYYTFIKR